MRDRLIELLDKIDVKLTHTKKEHHNKYRVNYLITNGVIVPPFRLGQEVWYVSRPRRKENIFSAKVIYITHTDMGFIISVEIKNGHRFEMDVEDLYSSREEAEQALKGGAE